MTLALADWLIIAVYFALSIAIGLYYTGRAGRSLTDYFLSGRSLPWWLAGTSMVATTFAADTPLVVTGLVVKYGVAGNWLWWNLALSGLLTVFLFSRLWRRAGVLTDVEFVELRYGGRPAAVLRGVRALYLALPINLIIMGWVTKAMADILQITLGISGWRVAALLFLITAGYSILAGLWGVIVTDFFQFIVAMGGSITLAVFAVNRVGGLDRLAELASGRYGSHQAALGILPPLEGGWLPLSSLLVFLAVQWWASWYPGAEPGGGGYVAQRIMSARDERHGLLATLWFNIAHYALRPWPWILVGLFAAVTYPDLTAPGADPGHGYARAMVDLLPSPLRGLLLAAFAAAYMSTIATHLNWGTSYFVNDFWLRFVRKGASDREQVLISRLATAVLMVLALVVMRFLGSIEAGWRILLGIGAGTGLVLILRWYWWRINAWSELAAMGASLVSSVALWRWGHLLLGRPDRLTADDPLVLVLTVAVTTAAWLAATLLTRSESPETLERFYRRARPGGPGWRAVATRLGFGADTIPGGALSWVNWVAGWVAVYATLFSIGQLLVGTSAAALGFGAVAVAAFALIARNLRQDAAFRTAAVDTPGGPP